LVGFVDTSLVLWLFPWACGLGSNFFPFLSYFFFVAFYAYALRLVIGFGVSVAPSYILMRLGALINFGHSKKIVGVEFGLK